MNETEFWICDKCGKKIEKVQDGWVEWMSVRDESSPLQYQEKNMRIVHRVNCIYSKAELMRNNATASDFYLEKYASPDGLMELLEILSDDRFVDKNEVIEIIKRIHIPGYEEARIYFDEAIAKGVFEPNTKPGFYSQCDIKAVLDYIHNDNR